MDESVSAQPGENVEDLSKCQKMRIKKRLSVLNGNLIDKLVRDEKGVERPAFIDCNCQYLWKNQCFLMNCLYEDKEECMSFKNK